MTVSFLFNDDGVTPAICPVFEHNVIFKNNFDFKALKRFYFGAAV